MTPDHINPIQWHQANSIARQSCARFFRDGGTPADAMRAFGLEPAKPAPPSGIRPSRPSPKFSAPRQCAAQLEISLLSAFRT